MNTMNIIQLYPSIIIPRIAIIVLTKSNKLQQIIN